jgi:hypothetical protein
MKHEDIIAEVLWKLAILSVLAVWILIEVTK